MVIPLLICLSFGMIVQCQEMRMTWNGTDITGVPTFIYHDELVTGTNPINDPNGPGRLICRSSSSIEIHWAFVRDGYRVSTTGNTENFYHRRQTGTPSLSRLSTYTNVTSTTRNLTVNGLWRCSSPSAGTFHVGLYSRIHDLGIITFNNVSLNTSSFESSPPRFRLVGVTRGGPPTAYTWSRNGQTISNSSSYSRLTVISEANREVAGYTSTLDVTGYLPGMYEYTVFNRAMAAEMSDSFGVQGDGPTQPVAVQTGYDTVLVSWTAPRVTSASGYRITVLPNGSRSNAVSSPHSITVSPGEHTIQILHLSQHFPGRMVEIEGFRVRGARQQTVTAHPESTSAFISWRQPPFSFPPVYYTITVSRVTGQEQVYCTMTEDSKPSINTTSLSVRWTELEEFSTYNVTVSAMFMEFGLPAVRSTSLVFNTPSAAPSGPPHNLIGTVTPTNIIVSWSSIECIERNGIITSYLVQLETDEATVNFETVTMNITASGLQPFTNYTFRVAGVNNNGRGPFTDHLIITTSEDVPSRVSNFKVETRLLTTVVFSWSHPDKSNGVLVAFELTYRINGSRVISQNFTDTSFALELPTNTTISDASVRAYTKVGPGPSFTAEGVHISAILPIPVVTNVQVMQLNSCSEISAVVSWEKPENISVAHYTVYYHLPSDGMDEISVSVPGTESSIIITDLISDKEYFFQVTAKILVSENRLVKGERSPSTANSVITFSASLETLQSQHTESNEIAIYVVATFLLTVTINTTVLVLIGWAYYRKRSAKAKMDSKQDHPKVMPSSEDAQGVYVEPSCQQHQQHQQEKSLYTQPCQRAQLPESIYTQPSNNSETVYPKTGRSNEAVYYNVEYNNKLSHR